MEAPHHRKIDLQSPADLTYLHTNVVALSRRKLDLNFPPSAAVTSNANANGDGDGDGNGNGDGGSDPMRERVKELIDEFINKTFTTATHSITINGLDASNPQQQQQQPAAAKSKSKSKSSKQQQQQQQPFNPQSLFSTTPTETIEYEPYDTRLAARVTSLYAQLESLTTTVAQLRRDAPRRAARGYRDVLLGAMREDDEDYEREDDGDVDMDMDMDVDDNQNNDRNGDDGDGDGGDNLHRRGKGRRDWSLRIPMGEREEAEQEERAEKAEIEKEGEEEEERNEGTDHEAQRWKSGDVARVYEDALRTLLRLQGEEDLESDGEEDTSSGGGGDGGGGGSDALATTVGKAERAGRAAEVVENM